MKILIISDSAITKGSHAVVDEIGMASIHTQSLDVVVMLAEDVVRKRHHPEDFRPLRGQRYNLVMIPKTLEFVEELHRAVYIEAKLLVAGFSGDIQYYE